MVKVFKTLYIEIYLFIYMEIETFGINCRLQIKACSYSHSTRSSLTFNIEYGRRILAKKQRVRLNLNTLRDV